MIELCRLRQDYLKAITIKAITAIIAKAVANPFSEVPLLVFWFFFEKVDLGSMFDAF